MTYQSILLCFLLLLGWTGTNEPLPEEKEEIEWMTFLEAVEKSKENPKKIFIDVYTTWCGWCKVMDKKTFSHPEIISYMNENFYAVKLDGEQKETIAFMDNEFKFVANGRRGYHELAASLLDGQLSYPTCVVMNEKLQRITTIPGYRDPSDMDVVLRYLSEDHYQTKSFAEFQLEYTSPIPKEALPKKH